MSEEIKYERCEEEATFKGKCLPFVHKHYTKEQSVQESVSTEVYNELVKEFNAVLKEYSDDMYKATDKYNDSNLECNKLKNEIERYRSWLKFIYNDAENLALVIKNIY